MTFKNYIETEKKRHAYYALKEKKRTELKKKKKEKF